MSHLGIHHEQGRQAPSCEQDLRLHTKQVCLIYQTCQLNLVAELSFSL